MSLPVAFENLTEAQVADFCTIVTQIVMGGLLYKFRQPVSRAGKGGWELWQVVTAIHDGSDGLMLCE
jgi:hypothetical protein